MENKEYQYEANFAPLKKAIIKIALFLIAVAFLLGGWLGIRAWEIHQEKDILTEIINIKPSIIPIEGKTIDELGRVTLSVGGIKDFEYIVVRITITYDTYGIVKNKHGEEIPTKSESIYIGLTDVFAGEGEDIYYQLNLEQLEHLEEIYYSIDRCKIR